MRDAGIEHPAVSLMRATGSPSTQTLLTVPVCPVCGKECDTLYIDAEMDVVGCDGCIKSVDAWDYVTD